VSRLEVVSRIADVRARVRAWHEAGERVAFVPTMGNLHSGHVSLLDVARQHGGRFVASIFVNPMQFGPNEDFAHYPRTPGEDERMLAEAGCDLMFMPDVKEVYPHGLEHGARVAVPELTDMLCGKFRPGHFEGVATVVNKLFNIVQPDVAVFGEKDYQQLAIIRRMVSDLCLPIEIVAAPTVREPDGLAMSSRNQYLTAEERRVAPRIYEALRRAADQLATGDYRFEAIEAGGMAALQQGGFRPDYFAVREAAELGVARPEHRHLVVLAAARLGKARLIDNVQVRR
jgi:pantoate--beta-alanine ligase